MKHFVTFAQETNYFAPHTHFHKGSTRAFSIYSEKKEQYWYTTGFTRTNEKQKKLYKAAKV